MGTLALVVSLLGAFGAGPGLAGTPTTTWDSVTPTGAAIPGGANAPAISADGRWLAFDSPGDFLPQDHNGQPDVFLRDRLTGAVTLVSHRPDGASGNNGSYLPSMSDDGQWVAFYSYATDLGATPGNPSTDVWLWNRLTGSLRRVSSTPQGTDGGGNSLTPAVSGDGSTVAFASAANDLVPGDPGQQDIFLADTAQLHLQRISSRPDGGAPNGTSTFPALNRTGTVVAWSSRASDLVAGDTNGSSDIFVRDMTGGPITRQSVNSAGAEAQGASAAAAVSGDGCLVSFDSYATNLVSGTVGQLTRLYVRNRCTGTTELASVDAAGAPGTVENGPFPVSADGCLVSFNSADVVSPALAAPTAFLRDRCAGLTSRIGLTTAGEAAPGRVFETALSGGPGRYVAFVTAGALNPGDTNNAQDIYVRDRATSTPPVADLQVVASGRRVTADASASHDPDGPTVTGSISFGDGTPPVASLRATHDYAAEGFYTVTATVTDGDGLSSTTTRRVAAVVTGGGTGTGGGGPATGGSGVGGVTSAPRITAASLSRATFKVAPAAGPSGRGRGAVLTVTLSRAATLRVVFQRVRHGHVHGGKCTVAARSGRPCTILRAAGALTALVTSGTSRVKLTGRIGRRALAPGAYVLLITARADGRTSAALKRGITVRGG